MLSHTFIIIIIIYMYLYTYVITMVYENKDIYFSQKIGEIDNL